MPVSPASTWTSRSLRINGRVIGPDDVRYDEARTISTEDSTGARP